ncbi:MAG: hypothetical protein RIC87_11445 [Kiloniellales bacterium]
MPEDPAALRALVLEYEAEVAAFRAEIQARDLMIEKLKLQLAGQRRHRFGARSETMDQLELTLEEAEISAAQMDVPPQAPQQDGTARPKDKPKRKPLPADLPRNEEILSPGETCGACGGRLRTLGEDVTEVTAQGVGFAQASGVVG